MTNSLNPSDFTADVAQKLGSLSGALNVETPQPLELEVKYGAEEPTLTLKLDHLYKEYQEEPDKLPVLVQPLLTEIGWTVHGKRYAFADIAEHTLPLMRDLSRNPFSEDETVFAPEDSKGPLVYQELVSRPEENVVVQFVLAKNEIIMPLYTGDMLRSYPEPSQLAQVAVNNLRNIVMNVGLTLSEYPIENFEISPWLVGFRGGRFREFLASLIIVPEVMATLENTLKADDGLVAILPAREELLVCSSTQETAVGQMGLLAKYLKDQSGNPVSSFIWHFKGGILQRVQTIDLAE